MIASLVCFKNKVFDLQLKIYKLKNKKAIGKQKKFVF
jgi:hypothetical protein